MLFPKPRKKRGFFAKIRLLFLWAVLLFCIAIQAPIFRHVVHGVIKFESWRRGVTVNIGSVEGTLFEPIVLNNSVWTYDSPTGTTTRLEIRRTRSWFAWSNVFPAPVAGWIRNAAAKVGEEPIGGNGSWWQRLELDGVSGKIELPGDSQPAGRIIPAEGLLQSRLGGGWMKAPVFFEMRDADLALVRGNEFVRLEELKFIASTIEPGSVVAGQVTLKTPWFEKTFRQVRGRTSMEGSRVSLAGLTLAPELKIATLGIAFGDLPKGKVAIKSQLDAFGGTVVTEAESVPNGKDLAVSANGSFSGINFGAFATFFGISDAAGGIVREGNFVFHGSPRNAARGDTRLRLEADRVQWESRQWDSLVLGLSIVDQRLGIPECRLKQGTNELTLSGAIAMPEAGASWWNLPFDLKVDASIRNLTELSALLLPEFTYTAGELFLRGAVSGSGAKNGAPPNYEGQVILNGHGLKWRTAPLEQLTGALVFKGRQLQIVNAQFENDDDFVRAKGVVSLDTGGFDGNIRLDVRDLKTYGALLGPPVFPAPIAGSARLAWTGTWNDERRKGEFTAKFGRFHMLGSNATHPVDAELAGTVEREHLLFSNFKVSQNGTSLTASVGVGPSLVNLSGLRLQKNGETWLEGDALLPLDLWQRWPDVNFTKLLNEDTVGRVNLVAKGLKLADAALLTGFEWPLAGTVNGNIKGDGALKSMKLSGNVSLAEGKIPLGWSGNVVHETSAEFSLDGKTIHLTKAAGRHADGPFELAGRLSLENHRAPVIEANGTGSRKEQPFVIKINGPAGAAKIVFENAPQSAPVEPPAD